MKAQSLRNTGGAGDDEGDSAISDSDASDGSPCVQKPLIYMSDPTVRTDLRKSMFDPKCAHFGEIFGQRDPDAHRTRPKGA